MAEPLLEARGIVKRFGRVHALRGANFTVNAGEVVALVGDNGAGKSTLVKRSSGVHPPDAGEIVFEGRPVADRHAAEAAARSGSRPSTRTSRSPPTSTPPPTSSSAARSCAAGLLGKLGFLDNREMRRRTDEAFTRPRRRRPGHEARRWRTCRAASARASRSAARSRGRARSSSWTSRRRRSASSRPATCSTSSSASATAGLAVVLISHNMPEVFEVADRIEVLRLGERVARFRRGEVTMEDVVGAMTGALAQSTRSATERDRRPTPGQEPEPPPEGSPPLAALRAGSTTSIGADPRRDDRRVLGARVLESFVDGPERPQHRHRRRGAARPRGRHDLRDHHGGHRPVGRRRARVLRRRRRKADERGRRQQLGDDPVGLVVALVSGLAWGVLNGS